MVGKITPKELQGRKDEFLIVNVREADELEEEARWMKQSIMPLGQLIRKARQGDLNDLKGNLTVMVGTEEISRQKS